MTDSTTTVAADITSDAHALIAKIDGAHDQTSEFSTLLANAKSAIVSAIQYVEAHFRALEAKIEQTPEVSTTAAAPTTETSAAADSAPAAAPASSDAPVTEEAAPAEASAQASTTGA